MFFGDPILHNKDEEVIWFLGYVSLKREITKKGGLDPLITFHLHKKLRFCCESFSPRKYSNNNNFVGAYIYPISHVYLSYANSP